MFSTSTMEFYMLSGFVGILKDVIKMLTKHVKTISCLAILIMCSSSIFFLSNFFSIKPLIYDMITSFIVISTQPTAPELPILLLKLKQGISDLVAVEWIYALISTLASLLLSTATIITSAVLHKDSNLSAAQLVLSTIRSIKKPFYTWFYTTLFTLGYNFFVFANLLPMLLVFQNPFAWKALYGILVILAVILYTYIAVVWNMAYVVSVLEEKSGIEALGKASELVKTMQVHGFFVNVVYVITYSVVMQGLRLMFLKQSSVFHVCVGLVVVNSVRVIWMLSLMAYTVFYYKCKKIHGEEVELQVGIEYAKVPTGLLLSESLP